MSEHSLSSLALVMFFLKQAKLAGKELAESLRNHIKSIRAVLWPKS